MKEKLAILLLLISDCAYSEITTDGSFGPQLKLSGPDFHIGAELGQQHGGNLFHSFHNFNIQRGESAIFDGPASVDNIIARVTGGDPSEIDGELRSSLPADLFFINPNGIIFGQDAKLNVQGGFYAGVANKIQFSDGDELAASTFTPSHFSSAKPAAFGFLGPVSASLTVNGSKLQVGESQTLFMAGGDLTIKKALISAPDGHLSMTTLNNGQSISLSGKKQISAPGGNISIKDSTLSSDGKNGGSISIQGEQLEIDHSFITAGTLSNGNGGGINIQVSRLEIRGGGQISTSTTDYGKGGDLIVKASDKIRISGRSSKSPTGIFARVNPDSSGDAGNITINTGNLEVLEGGQVSASTYGKGAGGSITINASENVRLEGEGAFFTGIFSQALFGDGDAGNLTINTDNLDVLGDGRVTTSTFSKGKGGNLIINAGNHIRIIGRTGFFNGILTQAYHGSDGDAGNLTIAANRLELLNGGKIDASTLGRGKGGDINIQTTSTFLSGKDENNFPSKISVLSGTTDSGRAGSISIKAASLTLESGTKVTSQTEGSDGGDIMFDISDYLYLAQATIATEVRAAKGDGGNITIAPGFFLMDKSNVNANAFEGNGGNVNIRSQGFYVFGVSPFITGALEKHLNEHITASSERGVSGEIRLESQEPKDIGKELTVLPTNLIDPAVLEQTPCAVKRTTRNGSSFIVKRYAGKRAAPNDWRGGSCLPISEGSGFY